jgi:2-polyprenyl-3-methyl-5-hydroxy-6-metoxy-1,4-benzoquinol methylase
MTTVTTAPETTFDEERMEAFVGRVLTDVSGWTTSLLAGIGDRLGLWRELADHGPLTSAELAQRTDIDERYAREWLGGMTTAAYLEYSVENETWTLPAEHVPVLAQEGGPMFFGGTWQMLHGMSSVYDELLEVFRTGGGVRQEAYHQDMWDGMERFTAGGFDNSLVQEWLPAMPDVDAALRAGATVADVGCGRARALIRLAQAYPEATFVGIDAFQGTIDQARANVEAAGLSDRITIVQADAAETIPGEYDVVFTFDVIHDAVDPAGILGKIREALRPGGAFVCLDTNASHHLEENVGPLGALLHGCSVLYCMTTSLAHGGEGLGSLGFTESVARTMCADAGFSSVRRVPLEDPFNILYEVRP